MEPDKNITKLLRLKRYEQPPGDYFEDFLAEFQLRQRAEVIQRPFIKVAWDRLRPILTPPPIPRLALACSFAVAIIAGVSIYNWSGPEGNNSNPVAMSLADGPNNPSGARQKPSNPAKSLTTVQYVLPAEVASYASRRSF